MTASEKQNYKPQTLCELCKKATGFCSWSKYGVQQPVEGWTAIRRDLFTTVKPDKTPVESYVVLDCPEFELEERDAWAFEKFDPEWIKTQVDSHKREQTAVKIRHQRRKAAQ